MSIEFNEDIITGPIISPGYAPQDAGEIGLRPKLLADYTGQEKAKGNLSIYIEAARRRNEPLDHTLLYGPPGLGKTTLAGVIANEMGVNIRVTSGPAIEKPGDLAALLTNLNPGDILFIDEIHQIVSSGRSDNSDNAAQMLKPALARRDMRVIGATTIEEARYIWSDKALARRFNEVKVKPLSGVAAKETATKILADYAAYHKVDVSAICPEELVDKTNYFLSTGVFPDNYINVVDETLASAVFEGIEAVDMTHFNATLSRMTGVVIL